MKRTTLISIAASLAAMMSLATSAQSLVVTVTNKSQNQRQELVSVDTKTVNEKLGLKNGDTFIVKNACFSSAPERLPFGFAASKHLKMKLV